MTTETIKFNNNLLAFLVENQKYIDLLACSKGGSDRAINTHREHNMELIDWYKKGNMIGTQEQTHKMYVGTSTVNQSQNKRKYEIAPQLKETLREHEVEMVEYMLKIGFYSSNDLYLTGVQRSIHTYCKTINENGLDKRMDEVKACISRVKTEMNKGNVKNKQAYLQSSLIKLSK